MKLAIWSPNPNPHLGPLFKALRDQEIDLRVIYSHPTKAKRTEMGWPSGVGVDSQKDFTISRQGNPWEWLKDWKDRIHIIPGINSAEHRKAAFRLIINGVDWIHLSEAPNLLPPLKSIWKAPLYFAYGTIVNQFSLGALGLGLPAERAFRNWGIEISRIGSLAYVPVLSEPERDVCNNQYERSSRSPNFLFVGQLIQRKGVDILLRAFASIGPQRLTARLTLLGRGEEEKSYRQLAKELGVQDCVAFIDRVPFNEMKAVYAEHDVLVLPSRHDGWGAVLNEAAQCGLALIASDRCGAAYHLVAPGLNGFRFRSNSVSSLASCLKTYTINPELVTKHGSKSKDISALYTPSLQAKHLVQQVSSFLALSGNSTELKT